MIAPFRLGGPVGNGRVNAPGDVRAVKHAFAALGRYSPPDSGIDGYIDRPLRDAVTRYQQDRHLKPDGWLAPGGETARNLALDLGGDPGGGGAAAPAAPAGPLALKDAVGDGRANRPDDVVAVKTALAGLGRYGTDRTRAPNPFLDRPLIGAVSAFQKEAGLKQDGWLAPGGETERALTAATAPPRSPSRRPRRSRPRGRNRSPRRRRPLHGRPNRRHRNRQTTRRSSRPSPRHSARRFTWRNPPVPAITGRSAGRGRWAATSLRKRRCKTLA